MDLSDKVAKHLKETQLHFVYVLGLIIKSYENCAFILGAVRDDPNFIGAFSGEEIRLINLLDRSLPGRIKTVQELQASDLIQNIDSLGKSRRAAREVRFEIMQLERVNDFIGKIESEIPEEKITVHSWMFLPLETLRFALHMAWLKMVRGWLKAERRIIRMRERKILSEINKG